VDEEEWEGDDTGGYMPPEYHKFGDLTRSFRNEMKQQKQHQTPEETSQQISPDLFYLETMQEGIRNQIMSSLGELGIINWPQLDEFLDMQKNASYVANHIKSKLQLLFHENHKILVYVTLTSQNSRTKGIRNLTKCFLHPLLDTSLHCVVQSQDICCSISAFLIFSF
jgi:hypothetical protein